ncbi:MAG TPA: hypothetical protein VFW65_12005 [Pseudonocardiaceae bacterium]|nr:hypothetical protein [Pseudonocardiaceae bacterium]
MWERHVPVGELYALQAFKQVRGRWILLRRCYGVALAGQAQVRHFLASRSLNRPAEPSPA